MSVGSEIRAICKKCGPVWHVVIALVDHRIAKVECRECGARHRYRDVRGARGGAKKQVVAADESRPRRDFSMSDTYEVGDRVLHATFGEGVVQQVAAPTKIVVLFDVGSKTLIHGRQGK